jgi:hypothetical protein
MDGDAPPWTGSPGPAPDGDAAYQPEWHEEPVADERWTDDLVNPFAAAPFAPPSTSARTASTRRAIGRASVFAPRSYLFFGSTPEFAVVVAGIHANEQGGTEVADWIRVHLAARPKPTKRGVLVIPEVFPDRGLDARTDEWKSGPQQAWREITLKGVKIFPARHFPPPGKAENALTKGLLIDRGGSDLRLGGNTVTQLEQIAYIVRCIETLRPTVIVSVHGKRARTRDDITAARDHGIITMTDQEIKDWNGSVIKGVNFPGIFVDPRYTLGKACPGFDLEKCKFDPVKDPAFPNEGTDADLRFDSAVDPDGRKDDAMALAMAQAVGDPTLVSGNHLDSVVPVVHYAKEGGTPEAFSLGDWGPVAVTSAQNGVGNRPGAPVFTIEVKDDDQSWAFLDGVQVMSDDGTTPLEQVPTPAVRAAGRHGKPFQRPVKFNPKRSNELQAYAKAIITVALDT